MKLLTNLILKLSIRNILIKLKTLIIAVIDAILKNKFILLIHYFQLYFNFLTKVK